MISMIGMAETVSEIIFDAEQYNMMTDTEFLCDGAESGVQWEGKKGRSQY